MLPYVYQVTKYDPADGDQYGHYAATEPATSDHGLVEAAYLQAVAAFAEDTGVDQLAVREPQLGGFAQFGLESPIDGYGLADLFPAGPAGFHDGALVPIGVGLELVRAMLRDNGAWCRLEMEGAFTVHVGWDQYLCLGSSRPCETALTRTRALGLFPVRLGASPYDFAPDDPAYVRRPADADFWARLHWTVSAHRAVFLEEVFAANASRWHRLTRDNIETVRSGLAPRSQLAVWPNLLTDVDTAVAALPDEDLVEVVWEDEDGRITSTVVDGTQFEAVTSRLASARAAGVVSMYTGEDLPLFTAVLPDSDGILRARWQTESPSLLQEEESRDFGPRKPGAARARRARRARMPTDCHRADRLSDRPVHSPRADPIRAGMPSARTTKRSRTGSRPQATGRRLPLSGGLRLRVRGRFLATVDPPRTAPPDRGPRRLPTCANCPARRRHR